MTQNQSRKFSFIVVILIVALILGLLVIAFWVVEKNRAATPGFDGSQALRDVQYQVGLGARVPGSSAHQQVQQWVVEELGNAGWSAEVQQLEKMGHPVRNIVATRGEGTPWIVIGAHYDSRIVADRDPVASNRELPVPAANDGASGVAVLLELARTLPATSHGKITLVFFDVEDNGNLPGWDWILGSIAYVETLQGKPDAAVILDMIGDADLNIYYEKNSNPALSAEIWKVAETLGYGDVFIPSPKFGILDDHTPFLRAGIPAVDIIDFTYPYYHTIQDTPDKVSADSLKAVGDTMTAWLISRLK